MWLFLSPFYLRPRAPPRDGTAGTPQTCGEGLRGALEWTSDPYSMGALKRNDLCWGRWDVTWREHTASLGRWEGFSGVGGGGVDRRHGAPSKGYRDRNSQSRPAAGPAWGSLQALPHVQLQLLLPESPMALPMGLPQPQRHRRPRPMW